MSEAVRALAHYSGSVQGVGFRYTARRAASGFAVAGYVRNLFDGRVEVVAEGTRAEISAFLGAVSRAMGDYIDDCDLRWQAASGEFSGFHIRY